MAAIDLAGAVAPRQVRRDGDENVEPDTRAERPERAPQLSSAASRVHPSRAGPTVTRGLRPSTRMVSVWTISPCRDACV